MEWKATGQASVRQQPGKWAVRLNGIDTETAVTASTNQHVDAVNAAVQQRRLDAGQLQPDTKVAIAGLETAYIDTDPDGTLVARHHQNHGYIALPALVSASAIS